MPNPYSDSPNGFQNRIRFEEPCRHHSGDADEGAGYMSLVLGEKTDLDIKTGTLGVYKWYLLSLFFSEECSVDFFSHS